MLKAVCLKLSAGLAAVIFAVAVSLLAGPSSALALDSDGDHLDDSVEAGLGTDPADPDPDNDFLTDGLEVGFFFGLDPLDPDTDDDGLNDGVEVFFTLNPLDPDSDDDGLTDGAEANVHHTHPLDPDSDDDGLGDGLEIQTGADPLDSDTDNDFIKDGADVEWLQNVLSGVPSTAFKNPNMKGAMLNSLDEVERFVLLTVFYDAAGQPATSDIFKGYALQALDSLRAKMDGCPAAPDQNDHITDCAVQAQVRPLVDTLIANVQGL